MADIKKIRQAYDIIRLDMHISEITRIAGLPDSCVGTLDDGILTWENSVWKGIFRGGTISRKVIIFTKGGKIVQFTSENLDVSNW